MRMTLKLVSLMFLAFLGCSQKTPDKKPVQLDKEFDLRIGQTASIDAAGFDITFTAVTEDSRCPQGVDCIWAGNAIVQVKISRDHADSRDLDLNTGIEPKERRYGEYRVSLVRLQPHPKKDIPIRKQDYAATFVVHKGG